MFEPAPSIPSLFDLITVDVADSSRAHAERLAQEGADEGTIVWARTQQEGIGRSGNYWMSGHRNLHCAIVLRPDDTFEICCQLSMVATICAAMAVSRQAEPLEEFRYRWPNDILLNQGKLAGITLSGEISNSRVNWMVVALNVNVFDHPKSKGLEAASMRGEGFQSYDRIALLEAYTREFLSWVNRWSDEGFQPIRQAWLFKGYQQGDLVSIKFGESSVSGVFKDIDPSGAIILETGSDVETISLSEFFGYDFHVKD